jgi:hypothetical protein
LPSCNFSIMLNNFFNGEAQPEVQVMECRIAHFKIVMARGHRLKLVGPLRISVDLQTLPCYVHK